MKKSLLWIPVFLCIYILPLVRADVEFVYVLKEKAYRQYGNDLATEPDSWSFGAGASGDSQLTAVAVTYPGSGGAVNAPGGDGSFDFDPDSFATKGELDAAFPNGDVSLSITDDGASVPVGPVSLTGDSYPNTPHLTNVDNLETHDTTQAFELTWNSFSGADSSARVVLQVWDEADDSEIVLEFLASSATSFTIPANSFSPDKSYRFELLFIDEVVEISSPESIIGYISSTHVVGQTVGTGESGIELVFLIKGQVFEQTDNSAPTTPFEWSFNAGVQGGLDVEAASFTYPGGSQVLSQPQGNFETQGLQYATQAAMDAAYPDGSYSFSVTLEGSSMELGPFTLTGSDYPVVPHVTNFEELKAHDYTQAFDLTWNSFTGSAAEDLVLFDIRDVLSGNGVFSDFLDAGATSYEIPANALQADRIYSIDVLFFKMKDGSETPQALVGYASSTTLSFNTFSSEIEARYASWITEYFDADERMDPAIVGKDADPDGDGQDNYFEFLAKFNPTDAASMLHRTVDGETIKVWPIQDGVYWEFHVSLDLIDWNPLDRSEYRITGDVVEFDIAPGLDQSFYRLELLETPPAG